MPITKGDQLGRYGRKVRRKRRQPYVKVPEKALQKQMNDTLNACGIKYLRIEDAFWSWLNNMHCTGKCPDSVYYPFCDKFGGMPDNIGTVTIGTKFNLSMLNEIKTKYGKKSKSQKDWESEVNVTVTRTTEENENIVKEFLKFANEINILLKER